MEDRSQYDPCPSKLLYRINVVLITVLKTLKLEPSRYYLTAACLESCEKSSASYQNPLSCQPVLLGLDTHHRLESYPTVQSLPGIGVEVPPQKLSSLGHPLLTGRTQLCVYTYTRFRPGQHVQTSIYSSLPLPGCFTNHQNALWHR